MLRQPSGFWGLFATDMIVRAAYQMAKSPVLPILAASLGANKLMIGTIVGVSTLTGSVLKPLIGALSDRFGRRVWFFTALVLFAGFPFLYRFVHTPDQLVWLRVLHGTATAIFGPVTLAIVTEMSTANRGARLGLFEMARGSGHLIAPGVAGGILAISSPETVFTVVGLVSCAAFVPALFVRFDETRIEPVDRPSLWREFAAGLRHAASRRELWFVGALEFAIYGSIYSLKAFLPIFALDAGYGVWAAGTVLHVPGGDASPRPSVRRQAGRPARLCADHRASAWWRSVRRWWRCLRCPAPRCCWPSPSWSGSARASPSLRRWP